MKATHQRGNVKESNLCEEVTMKRIFAQSIGLLKLWASFFIFYSSETSEKDRFKQILRRLSKDINEFSFKAPMIAKKSDDFIDS